MKKLLCLCVSALLIGACSKKNDPVANVREAAKDKDLQEKTFVSDCSAKPLDALWTGIRTAFQASIKGERTAYRVQGANITRTTRLFSTLDCSGDAAYTFEEKGTVTINKDPKYKSNDGGYLIDITYDKLSVAMATQEGTTVANTTKLCGITDWAPSKSRDVTAQAKTCYGATLPRYVANRYRVDADVLYLGTATKGEKSDKDRPATLDMGTKYTAQK